MIDRPDESYTWQIVDPLGAPARRRVSKVLGIVAMFVRREPLGAAGTAMLVLAALAATAAPVLVGDYRAIDASSVLAPPSAAHWLGTDQLGRSMASRIVYGARSAFLVGIGSVALAIVVATVVGVVCAYVGGIADLVIQRVVEGLVSLPIVIVALVVVASLGPSIWNVIGAISIGLSAGMSRVIRSAALAISREPYVEAALVMGCSPTRVMSHHVARNVLPIVTVLATAALGQAIIAEASLSFLGFGVPPPAPSWGGMLAGAGREFAERAPWLAICPGLAICLVVLSFNFVGDAMRDELDPRLRTR
jgi:peptide/nickel transport system permease protein